MNQIQIKQVGHLRDLLADIGITTEPSLRRLIDGRGQLTTRGVVFNVLRSADLLLDSECRICESSFVHRRTIFDCSSINVLNSTEILLHDCIVLGSLRIANKIDKAVSVSLDTTIILNELLIDGLDTPFSSISLTDIRAKVIRVEYLRSPLISIPMFTQQTPAVFRGKYRTLDRQGEVILAGDVRYFAKHLPPALTDTERLAAKFTRHLAASRDELRASKAPDRDAPIR